MNKVLDNFNDEPLILTTEPTVKIPKNQYESLIEKQRSLDIVTRVVDEENVYDSDKLKFIRIIVGKEKSDG